MHANFSTQLKNYDCFLSVHLYEPQPIITLISHNIDNLNRNGRLRKTRYRLPPKIKQKIKNITQVNHRHVPNASISSPLPHPEVVRSPHHRQSTMPNHQIHQTRRTPLKSEGINIWTGRTNYGVVENCQSNLRQLEINLSPAS